MWQIISLHYNILLHIWYHFLHNEPSIGVDYHMEVRVVIKNKTKILENIIFYQESYIIFLDVHPSHVGKIQYFF